MPANRMHRGLVALSASAVAAIYMVGYVRTQSADATIGTAEPPTSTLALAPISAVSTAATATSVPAPTVEPFISRQPPVAPRLAATPLPTAVAVGAASAPAAQAGQAAQAGYKDGT